MPLQGPGDNGSVYATLDVLVTAKGQHLVPITTTAASPESYGMSKALVDTLRRGCLADADLLDGGRGARQDTQLARRLQHRGSHSAPGCQFRGSTFGPRISQIQ